jgi:hypothetical protein
MTVAGWRAEHHGTLVVIAHRISSAINADHAVLMDRVDAVLGGPRLGERRPSLAKVVDLGTTHGRHTKVVRVHQRVGYVTLRM